MQSNNKQSYATSLFLVGCLFFIFGFVTWLNGTLIPFLKMACQLNNLEAYLVTFAFYISYFFMAIPSSFVLKKTGFKKGMSLGLVIMAIGTIIFIPAAHQRNYAIFLTGLFMQGLGLTILQTAVNPYVTILGPEESAAKRISIMGVANKIAGIVSPIIIASFLFNNIDALGKQIQDTTNITIKNQLLDQLAHRIISPYLVMTIVLIILAILIVLSPLPELHEEKENPEAMQQSQHPTIFKHTYLWLGTVALFLYVGAEVLAGDSVINYGKYLGISLTIAKYFTPIVLTLMVIGYLIGIAVMPKLISQEKALRISAVLGVLFCTCSLLTNGITCLIFLFALGLANALMWPAIWPMSLKGLGKFTKIGAALLIMGIAGGALIPLLYGYIADKINSHMAYVVLLPCYLFILFFAISGHKIGYTEPAKEKAAN